MHPPSISVAPTSADAVPPPAFAVPLLADAPTAGVAPVLLLFDFGEDMSAARQCADADRTETPPVCPALAHSLAPLPKGVTLQTFIIVQVLTKGSVVLRTPPVF